MSFATNRIKTISNTAKSSILMVEVWWYEKSLPRHAKKKKRKVYGVYSDDLNIQLLDYLIIFKEKLCSTSTVCVFIRSSTLTLTWCYYSADRRHIQHEERRNILLKFIISLLSLLLVVLTNTYKYYPPCVLSINNNVKCK